MIKSNFWHHGDVWDAKAGLNVSHSSPWKFISHTHARFAPLVCYWIWECVFGGSLSGRVLYEYVSSVVSYVFILLFEVISEILFQWNFHFFFIYLNYKELEVCTESPKRLNLLPVSISYGPDARIFLLTC